MFVSQSEIHVPADDASALEMAFRHRMRAVDGFDGFLGIELLRDTRKPGHYLLLTRWHTQKQFHDYLKSSAFKAAHERQHHGVVEPEGGAPLRQFESILNEATP